LKKRKSGNMPDIACGVGCRAIAASGCTDQRTNRGKRQQQQTCGKTKAET
jgi:hypothetical protein